MNPDTQGSSFIAPPHAVRDQQFCLLLPQPTFASVV